MDANNQLSHAEEADQFARLLLKHLREEINTQERQELNEWIAEHDAYKRVFERINNEEQMMNDLQLLRKVNLDNWWQKISRQAATIAVPRPFYRRPAFYLMLLLLAAAGVLAWFIFM